ncbi:MAG: SPFH domain-containing protein [Candidatus Bathyarchaeota archaeon]|nr:SPFH domain-containing protein [Candidatus Bathyarchaeota archaeon]
MFGVVAFVSLGFLPACVAINKKWEEVIVLRFGKFQRLVGPGFFFRWPLAESFLKQDKRIVILDVSRQEVMTRDNISVSIKVSRFSLFFGLVAFLMGGAGIIGYSLPLIPTIMTLVGLFIIASALRKMAK